MADINLYQQQIDLIKASYIRPIVPVSSPPNKNPAIKNSMPSYAQHAANKESGPKEAQYEKAGKKDINKEKEINKKKVDRSKTIVKKSGKKKDTKA